MKVTQVFKFFKKRKIAIQEISRLLGITESAVYLWQYSKNGIIPIDKAIQINAKYPMIDIELNDYSGKSE